MEGILQGCPINEGQSEGVGSAFVGISDLSELLISLLGTYAHLSLCIRPQCPSKASPCVIHGRHTATHYGIVGTINQDFGILEER